MAILQVCDTDTPQERSGLEKVRQYFSGIIRYVSDTHAKNITKDEFETALELGLAVALVCEQADQQALRGAQGAQHDARIANAQADAVGYDPDATIYYIAEDPHRLDVARWPTVEEYFRNLSGRPRGAYGGLKLVTHLMDLGLASHGWVVESWGGESPRVHLVQRVNNPDKHGLHIDVDSVVQADFGQHPRPRHVPLEGEPEGEDVGYSCVDPITGGYWVIDPIDGHVETLPGKPKGERPPYIGGLNNPPNKFNWQQVGKIAGIEPFEDVARGGWGFAVIVRHNAAFRRGAFFSTYEFPRDGSERGPDSIPPTPPTRFG